MSLSDRDIELACKYAEELASNYDGDDRQDIKTDVMNAFYAGAKFIAERDQLAIKEKDDAVREALEKAAEICETPYGFIPSKVGILLADRIRALIEPKD